jgi:hypothetical protein
MKSTNYMKLSVETAPMPISTNPFKAEWSAKGHLLCLGHWIILFNDKPIELNSKQANNHMDTFGNFSWLYEDDDAYIEGSPIEDWIEQNADWLNDVFKQHAIRFDEQHINWFYEAVHKQDWRCSSCGGCI